MSCPRNWLAGLLLAWIALPVAVAAADGAGDTAAPTVLITPAESVSAMIRLVKA